MSDEDRTQFYADRFTDTKWEYAASLLDDAFGRLGTALAGLSNSTVTIMGRGLVVGSRGIIEFRGQTVTVADDPVGDRIVVTLPDYGSPVGLGNAAADGTSAAVPHADHVHKRDVRVKKAGIDVGTRNAINFGANLIVTDNPGSDSVDVAAAASLLPLTTVLLGTPEFVWDDNLNLIMAEEGG